MEHGDIHEYWRQRLEQVCADRDDLLDHLRDEVSRLQQRCGELSSTNALSRAAASYDVMQFATTHAVPAPNGEPFLSVDRLNEFLHHYTEGMIPFERSGKRCHDTLSLGHSMLTNVTNTRQRRDVDAPRRIPQHIVPTTAAVASDTATSSQTGQQNEAAPPPPPPPPHGMTCKQQHERGRGLVERHHHIKRPRDDDDDDFAELQLLPPRLFSRVP